MVTYQLNYDPDVDGLSPLIRTQSKSTGALIIGAGVFDNRIGNPGDGSSISSTGQGIFKDFNGYPMKNIGWEFEFNAYVVAGATNQIGIQFTFDNGDIFKFYAEGLNENAYFEYSGSQTQAKIAKGLGSGGHSSANYRVESTINGSDRVFTFFDTNTGASSTVPFTGASWDQNGGTYTVTGGKSLWITEMKIFVVNDHVALSDPITNPTVLGSFGFDIQTSDTLFTGAIVGFDASIPIRSYTLRTALNAGGNAVITTPNPFFEVSATTLKAQLKKSLTYTNVFGIKQWQGETSTLDIGYQIATYEASEMIRKTMGVEVLASPIIFSTFLRQWNGLVIEDKDGGFVSRGVTTSHIVAFEKANTKVYEGRATRDNFQIVDEDLASALVPDTINNGLDEEMYYYDSWNTDDSTQAHIMIHAADDLQWFAVRYPVDIYEKFNNLTKLNKLEIISTISAYREDSTENADWSTGSGDDGRYVYYVYNYHIAAFEKIKAFSKSDLKGTKTLTSTGASADTYYYDPRDIIIDVAAELKNDNDEWLIGTDYTVGDRAFYDDILYTCISNSTGDQPPNATFWQRTVYDFINYESTAGSAPIFSKLNIITAIRTPTGQGNIRSKGIWVWSFSVRAAFDEDNKPEYSSASIASVAADGKSITLNATSGINLPEKDGFGVGDIIHIVKNIEDYLQDSWDASPIASDLGALTINITNSTTIGVLEDHTYKSFFSLMQHISGLSNSTFWANYAATNTVLISSADNHTASGLTLIKIDLYNYDESNWSISYDAKPQKNKVRILGENVNFIKTLSPALDPFDLGDETEIIDDSDIKTLLQASDKANALTPRMEDSEVIVRLTLDYSNPIQNYATIKVGNTVILKLPTAADTSIFNDTLLIMAIDLNRNKDTGDNEHATLTLQKRYS